MTAPDYVALDRAALSAGRTFLHALAPGRVRNQDHVAFDPSGALGTALIDFTTGVWRDKETGDRGNGVIPWLAHVRGLSLDDAAREIAARLISNAPKPVDEAAPAVVPINGGHVDAAQLAPGAARPAVLPEAPELRLVAWQGRIAKAATGPAPSKTFLAACLDMAASAPLGDPFRATVKTRLWECAQRQLGDRLKLESLAPVFYDAFPEETAADDEGANVNPEPDARAVDSAETDAEIARLAKLAPLEYGRQRKVAAERLGTAVTFLDSAVKAARGDDDPKGQGRAPSITEAEPWHASVNLAETLDDAVKVYERYLILPPGGAEKMALWGMLTHTFASFPIVPRLLVTAATRECAKSLLLRVLKCTAARVVMMTNANIAPLFRSISAFRPSIFLDEADNYINENPELLALLNDGYAHGGVVWRCEGESNQVKEFDVFAPVAIAMINRPRDTLLSRSLVIRMERKKPGERTANFRGDRPADDLGEIQRKFARAAIDYAADLRAADPDMGRLFNRDADNWRPLFAIADLAGGRWPALIREVAARDISAKVEESTGETLLADCRWIFEGGPIDVDGKPELKFARPADRVRSADMAGRLAEIEGRPWGEWKNGKPITATALARRLAEFGIQTRGTRFDDGTFPKAYHRADFEDVFGRYLANQTATPPQPLQHSGCGGLQTATCQNDVAAPKAPQPLQHSGCGGVAVSNRDSGDMAGGMDL